MSLSFERPLLLLLVPCCLGLTWLIWRTSRVYMPPLRRCLSLVLRLAVITVLISAMAEPRLHLLADDLAVAFLLDRSDSITPAVQVDQERWLADALKHKGQQDQAAVISFGGEPVVDRALSPDPNPPRLSPASNVSPSSTNIASAIRSGLALLPASLARRLVLLSDGQENQEKSDSAAALAAAAGVQIVAVPMESVQGPEVLVRALDAPSQVRQGDRFTVSAQLQSNVSTSATLYLTIDGRLATTQTVSVEPGSSRFLVSVDPLQPGHHVLNVQLQPELDTFAQNNVGGAYVVVQGPPRVLVVEGVPGEGRYLVDALRTLDLQVDVTGPDGAGLDASSLQNYASAVLVDVPADALPAGRMLALKSYVRDRGGGLLVVGGDKAFGPGGYARTPLEDMLPVRMDLRGKSLSASVALMIVMDVSGSMGGGPGGASKMDLAKEAALAAVELLGEYDQVGILAFDDHNQWMIHPTFASDLTPIEDAISRMQPGGGTEIYPALKEGFEALVPLDAKIKHVILLTDGQAPRGPYEELAKQMDDAQVTVSTVGIGSDADTPLLQEVAALGHGRYYDGNDPFDLPQLLVKETQQVQRAAIVEEDFTPLAITTNPATDGIDLSNAPPLRGYVATTPRPQSTVLLASRLLDPLLAEWQYGLGRVMAWTSDAKATWAARWLEWPEFSRFWSQLVKRTARSPEDPNRQISVTLDGDHARITLDAQTGAEQSERRYLNFAPANAVVVDPLGAQSTVPLPQVAPGRYEASVPIRNDGVYTVTATQTEAAGGQAIQSGGFVVPYSREYALAETNRTLLDALARRTGGRLSSDPADAFAHTLPSVGAPQPLWPLLMVLMAVLVVMDVGVRRVRITAPELKTGYAQLRRRMGYVDDLSGFVRAAPSRAVQARAPTTVPAVSLAAGPDRHPASVSLEVRPTATRADLGLVGRTSSQTVASDRGRPNVVAMSDSATVLGSRRAPVPDTHSSRLLAAKQRAARR